MPDITLEGPSLPFVLGGNGAFTVRTGALPLDQPVAAGMSANFEVQTGAGPNGSVAFGGTGSWSLSLKREGGVQLALVWPSSDTLVRQYGLASYFARHPNDVVVLLTAGASGEGKFAGEFKYSVLTAATTLEAGADASFAYARAFPGSTPLGVLVNGFLPMVHLPASPTVAPAPGEVIKFEYGGYLNFGASLAAGYEMKGTPSVNVGELMLSESYDLSVIGKIGVSAQVGGFFGVEIRGTSDPADGLTADWARVIVRKTRAQELTFAADARVEATSTLSGLPEAPHEFLGALLGVNVRSWLNLLDRIRRLSDWNSMQEELDALAVDFLSSWVDKKI